MKTMKVNENGFTLIELMFVLVIVSIILAATYQSYANRSDQQTFDYWYQQLELDLLYLQKKTMTTGQVDRLTFEFGQDRYAIREGAGISPTIVRDIPDHWQVQMLNLSRPISFKLTGQIKYAGTMRVITNDAIYYIYFPLGKGRIRYAKRE